MQVGLIAAVCFAIGVLWPTLSGISLVPEVPGRGGQGEDEDKKTKPKPARPQESAESPNEVPVAANVPQGPKKSHEATAEVEKTLVVNCRDENDRRQSQCDTPAFDQVAEDRLRALAACTAAQQADGVVSIGFELDFKRQKIAKITGGKSGTLDASTTESLLECARREFMSASLKDVAHTHARYLLFYMVRLRPPGAVVEERTEEPTVAASGTATVIWASARIRSAPEDGDVRERLLYGTKVVVTGRRGDWYKIRYDAKGSEGWVHRNALAL